MWALMIPFVCLVPFVALKWVWRLNGQFQSCWEWGRVIKRWQEVKPLQWRKITVLLRRHFLYAYKSSWAGSEYTNKASRIARRESMLVYVRPRVLSPSWTKAIIELTKGRLSLWLAALRATCCCQIPFPNTVREDFGTCRSQVQVSFRDGCGICLYNWDSNVHPTTVSP